MLNCHCRDCQLGSGSGYSATLVMAASAVRVTKGQARCYEKTAESGNIATREFCEICGTPLFASSSGRPEYVGVKAASLDNPGWFKPAADVWVASAQAWDCMDPDIPKFQKSRPQTQQQ